MANQKLANQKIKSPVFYLRDKEVALRYAVCRATVYRWVKEVAGFPAPIRITSQCTRWRLSDLERWEKSHIG